MKNKIQNSYSNTILHHGKTNAFLCSKGKVKCPDFHAILKNSKNIITIRILKRSLSLKRFIRLKIVKKLLITKITLRRILVIEISSNLYLFPATYRT